MERRLQVGGVLIALAGGILLLSGGEGAGAEGVPIRSAEAEGIGIGIGAAAVLRLLAVLLILLLVFGGVVDLVIGGVDLVHPPCRLRVIGMQIRVILLGKAAVGFFDLVGRGVRRHPQHRIGVLYHEDCSSFLRDFCFSLA